MKRYLVLELELSKDTPDLADKIAGRVYVLDGVEDVRVKSMWTDEPDFDAVLRNAARRSAAVVHLGKLVQA